VARTRILAEVYRRLGEVDAALRAVLPEQTTLSGGEQHLLREWLDRLAAQD
jgi:hypothetical protein